MKKVLSIWVFRPITGGMKLCMVLQEQVMHKEGQYFISSDQMNWHEVKLEDAKFDVMYFSIPENLRQAENVYFKYVPAGEASVAGFALLS